MIIGTVSPNREPVVRLRVRGPSGDVVEVDAVVDTGYTGALVLPHTVVAALGLYWLSGGTAVLADGSSNQIDYYESELEWGQQLRPVIAMCIGSGALLGMQLLDGHRLTVNGTPGGAVEIVPHP